MLCQEDDANFCLDKLNIKRDEIEDFVKNDSRILEEDNERFNSFAACYFEKRGFIDEKGKVNFDNLIKPFLLRYDDNQELKNFILNKCNRDMVVGSSPGQTAVKGYNCVNQKAIEFIKNQTN